ncbi:MAG: SAM-dependent methyltransferase, partial [Limnohabitans sp.]
MQALLDALARANPGQQACRVFHGRGGLFAGCEHLNLDWYPPVWVLTSFAPLDDAQLLAVHTALSLRPEPLNWVYQLRPSGPGGSAAPPKGRPPPPPPVVETTRA